MRKFCQNLRNAQLFRPKTGSLPLFLPSAAGQNSDTFSILHTVEPWELLQGREKIGGYPFRHRLRRCHTPPFVATRHLPPAGGSRPSRGRLNSLSQNLTVLPAPSGREPLARPETLCLSRKLCRHAKGPIPEGAVAVGDWGSSSPQRLFFLHRNVLLIMVY